MGLELGKWKIPEICNPALPSTAGLSLWPLMTALKGLISAFLNLSLRGWEKPWRKHAPNTAHGFMVRVIRETPHRVLQLDHPPASLPLPEKAKCLYPQEAVWPLGVQ